MRDANRKIHLFANWKMYLNFDESVALARELAQQAFSFGDESSMVLFPNALSLPAVRQEVERTPIAVGAQNFYWVERAGATGEISAEMFKAAGCEYALVGHSERRHLFKETNHDVRQKLEAALRAGLIPVLCVGETHAERQEGQTKEVLEAQLRAAFTDLAWPADRQLFIAYEPVWAVGTGEACEPAAAGEMSGLINTFVRGLMGDVSLTLLYGGSVRGGNVRDYVGLPGVQGVLVGGASTKFDSWMEIVRAVKGGVRF